MAGMHAFLFADLRGYTQFAATRGDRAAAELLDRYRTLVRAEIARHAGAEVRTEGDSFYVVFTSVSEAVQCALAIAAAALQASLDEPALPVNVGIGVHFGETVDTAEGSVGSAVNLAARLASAAGPNEVLVSDVVRSLLRGTTDVATTSAGSRRLKGFAEPVSLYRASAVEETARTARGRSPLALRRALAALAALPLLIVALVVVTQLGVLAPSGSPTPSGTAGTQATPSPSVGATTLPFKYGQLDAGRYIDRQFVPNVSLEVDDGWCGGFSTIALGKFPGNDTFYIYSPGSPQGGFADQQGDPCAGFERDDEAGSLALYRVELVYGPTACEDGATISVGRSWNALVDYLTTLSGTTVTNRVSASFGGALGVAFDLHVDAGTVCPLSGAPVRAVLAFPMTVSEVPSGRSHPEPRWFGEGQYMRLWVVDVDSQLVVAVLTRDGSTTPLSTVFTRKAYPVIDSLRFVPSG
jgi:class 3 adenylate cyclase